MAKEVALRLVFFVLSVLFLCDTDSFPFHNSEIWSTELLQPTPLSKDGESLRNHLPVTHSDTLFLTKPIFPIHHLQTVSTLDLSCFSRRKIWTRKILSKMTLNAFSKIPLYNVFLVFFLWESVALLSHL